MRKATSDMDIILYVSLQDTAVDYTPEIGATF